MQKQGRRISAAMRAKLAEAIGHSEKFVECLRSVLADDDEAKAAELLATWSLADARLNV
jgi:hypothetical protein